MLIVEVETTPETLVEITSLAFKCGSDQIRQVKRNNQEDALTALFASEDEAMEYMAALRMYVPDTRPLLFDTEVTFEGAVATV